MGLLDFFKGKNLATRGADPNTALFAALEALGLRVIEQDTAFTRLAGSYKGLPVGIEVDATRIMGVHKRAMRRAATNIVTDLLGVYARSWQDWQNKMSYFRARTQMQNAQILYKWAVFWQGPAIKGNLGTEDEIGQPLGNGLYGSGDQAILTTATDQQISSMLLQPTLDELSISAHELQAFWAPAMKEYQYIAASPERFSRFQKTP